MMLRKFPTLKNPSDLKTSFSLKLCLFIKTSWSFGAPKIPQSPFCQKLRKIEMIPNLSCHPCHFPVKFQETNPKEMEASKKTPNFWVGLFFPWKKATQVLPPKRLPPLVLIQDVVSICLPKLARWKMAERIPYTEITEVATKVGFLKDIFTQCRTQVSTKLKKTRFNRTKGNLNSSGLTGVDQCKRFKCLKHNAPNKTWKSVENTSS